MVRATRNPLRALKYIGALSAVREEIPFDIITGNLEKALDGTHSMLEAETI